MSATKTVTAMVTGAVAMGSAAAHAAPAAGGDSFWLPERASGGAAAVDGVFDLVFWFAIFLFTLLAGMTAVLVLRFRRRSETEAVEATPHDHGVLAALRVAAPLLMVVVLFTAGLRAYLDAATPPSDAYEVAATGGEEGWTFTYPNGVEDDTLTVPTARSVNLLLSSEDATRSLAVPAFRIRREVGPGRPAEAWFAALEPGVHDLRAAEYRGSLRDETNGTVVVKASEDFDGWLAERFFATAGAGPAGRGSLLYTTLTCVTCHSLEPDKLILGPSFADLFGSERLLEDGTTAIADEAYIRESILEPQARIGAVRAPDAVMTPIAGVTDADIDALIAYMKTLSVHAPAEDGAGGDIASAAADTTTTGGAEEIR